MIYNMGDTELQSIVLENDLGVYDDETLKYRRHVSFAVNRATRMLWRNKMTFSCLYEDIIPRLYKALIRPQLA